MLHSGRALTGWDDGAFSYIWLAGGSEYKMGIWDRMGYGYNHTGWAGLHMEWTYMEMIAKSAHGLPKRIK
jgi:hypothetical protein